MATSKWTATTSEVNLLTTELNTLTDGDRNISSAFSNDASDELYLYGIFKLYLATQGSARSAGANCALYILPEVNGTYPYGDDALDPPAELLVWSFSFDAAVTARYAVSMPIMLPPTDFKVMIKNNTGQTLASSGNILSYEKHNIQSVA